MATISQSWMAQYNEEKPQLKIGDWVEILDGTYTGLLGEIVKQAIHSLFDWDVQVCKPSFPIHPYPNGSLRRIDKIPVPSNVEVW